MAFASSIDTTAPGGGVVFSGTGTVSVNGTVYARSGMALTLRVATSSDTECVDVAGAFTGHQQGAAKSTWTFSTTAGAGGGVQAVTATASKSFNPQGKCTGSSGSAQGSYTLDNTGPIVTAALTPAANAAGWNNTDVTVKWTATDAGVGVAAAQPFQTDSALSENGIIARSAPAQTDRLGNVGAAGSVTVRIDKAAPTITAVQTKNGDGTTTVTFTCSDSNAGGGQASGIASCIADGSTTNSKTVQPGATVTGSATDMAGNNATASSTVPAGDTTAPTLAGAPTTAPNGAGWSNGDVTVHWTAADPESGITTPPADTTITGEGIGLTSTTTVTNGAGLSTTATSSPAVNIDRTAPTTGIGGTSNNWVNGNVTVTLTADDNLSTVAQTEYSVDGGAAQTGTTFTLSTEGDHTITYFSTDRAGNVEGVQTAHAKIDKTAPTISHAFAPLTYADGAWSNQDVTATFTCADQGGSGVAGCTAPVTKSAEGSYSVTGTATDNGGNSGTDSASIRIDKTAPTIVATAGGTQNAAGWYTDDVIVTYSASDADSGIATTPANDVLGEGANQSASATVTDAAGNSNSAGVTGINVDKTAPVVEGSFASGWHTDDVIVNWSCTDVLSQPVAQPADTTVSGEGDNLTSTANCTDVAGNTATNTVTGIKIDRSRPTTTSTVATPLASGWYSDAVLVTLNGSDNLSGIAATYYTVDGAATQTYSGAFPFGTEGEHEIAFWSEDGAGNVEIAGSPLTLRIDTIAPTTTLITPISPDSGWFVTSGIPFAFDANDSGSGIDATYYTIDGGPPQTYGEPFTANLSTGTHTVTYWSVDLADNAEVQAETNTVQVKVDTILPTITGSQTPAANAAGWNNTDVDVAFTCTDEGSGLQTGIAGCAGDTKLSNEGADQMVHGDAVDLAGNRSTIQVGPIKIDKSKPTLTGAPTTDANAEGWYRSDVRIAWTGDDNLSGLNLDTYPANSTITGEGRTQSAGPETIADNAGNVSDEASVTGVKIDRTAPTVAGVLPPGKNAAGWYKGDVVVGFTCSDPVLADGTAGSGVAACPSDVMLKGDGANQSVTSAVAIDVAGNASEVQTVTGINIDGHEPQTTADNQCTATNGYCKGSTATVLLSSADVGPSGVKEIHYTVNDGIEQVAPGATATLSIPTDGTGHATFTYYAVDEAGNVEPANHAGLDYDNIAPTVSHTVSPAANAADWNNSNVTVHFNAKDTDPGSGVDTTSVTPDVTISSETTALGLLISGSAKDNAENEGTDSVIIKLDKTAPSVSGAIVPGTTMVNGWYTGAVKVHFTCSDALSGIGVCPDDVTLTSNGANQSVTRSATDLAGNTASATVSGITIDNENPTVTSVNVSNGSFTLGAAPAATCSAADSFSGVASCKVTVTGGNANGVGTFNYIAQATDKAGNTSPAVAGTYAVKYRFDGFLQPVNDTAHQIGTSTSVFKAGSTVPVKFQLKNAAGQVVPVVAAPIWLTPVRGSAMNAPVDETAYMPSADSGSTYRCDAGAQQFIYNWKTGAGGNYWRIGVKLDDGQTYYVNIGLR